MLEIVICDDDNSVLEQTRQLIDNWADSISVPVTVKTTDNGDMLLSYCSRSNPDVIILDIMMPFLNGMDAAKEIREHNSISKIIFLTSSPGVCHRIIRCRCFWISAQACGQRQAFQTAW